MRGSAVRATGAAALARGAQHRAEGGERRPRRRHRPRDAGRGGQGLPAADRPRRAWAMPSSSRRCAFSAARNVPVRFGHRLRALDFAQDQVVALDFGEDKMAIGGGRCRDPRRAAGRGRGSGARSHDAVRVPRHRQCAFPARSARRARAHHRDRQRHHRVAVRLPRSLVGHHQRGRSIARCAARGLAATDLAGGRGRRRSSQDAAAVADRARTPRDLRRDAGRECQAPRRDDGVAQSGPRRRLDQDRLAGDHRRGDPVRQSGGRARRPRRDQRRR